jgi:hypothetical protein
MSKTNITIRVDEDLKKSAEQACDFLGVSMTSLIHTALHQAIAQASHYKSIHEYFTQQMKAPDMFMGYSRYILHESRLPPKGFNPKDYESSGVTVLQIQNYLYEILELAKQNSIKSDVPHDD